MNNNLKKG